MCFFFNDTATTEIYTLSLHDALPIFARASRGTGGFLLGLQRRALAHDPWRAALSRERRFRPRSEEHTSELQSRQYLVCRLLLEKKKHITSSDLKTNIQTRQNLVLILQ